MAHYSWYCSSSTSGRVNGEASLSPSTEGSGVDVCLIMSPYACRIVNMIRHLKPLAELYGNLATPTDDRTEECMSWGALRMMLDCSVEVLEFIVSQLCNDVS